MTIQLKKTEERFPFGRLPVILFSSSLVLTYVLHIVFSFRGTLCIFKLLTGVNCPSCGLTRSFLTALNGQFVEALLFNPLLFIFSIVFILLLLMQLIFRLSFNVTLRSWERSLFLLSFLAMSLFNWIFFVL
jgi:hypothetical protein